ncbi:MAG: alpha/beta fold hydrolase [Caulobacteraceae bacterium]
MTEPTTSTIVVGDLRFTMDHAGPKDGPPVLLLHGFPQSRRAWTRQIDALSQAGFRCFAPDQRGYSAGARPLGIEAHATPNLVGDALDLMDCLGYERFHLVGHDWGGQLAWLIAAVYAPDRVESLAVLSRPHPAAFARVLDLDSEQRKRSGHHKAYQDATAATDIRANDTARFRKAFALQGVPAEAAQAYIRTLEPPGALEAAIAWYRAGGVAPRLAEIPSVLQKTLYVWGDADRTVGRMAAEATGEFVQGPYRFENVPGGGHFLTDQFPDAISALLRSHLEE